MASKYDTELESFFDLNFFYPISEFLMPIFKFLSFTPNMITTLSLITISFAVYFLFVDSRISALFLIISYTFDCLDGMFARKYNMCSAFGMAYDYTKDGIMNTIFFLTFIYIYTTYFNLNFWIALFFSIITAYLTLTWLGINEAVIHYKKHQNTNYFMYRKNQFKKKNIGNLVYINISKFFYNLIKPYIQNPKKMKSYSKALKIFGLGNLIILCFIIMNIFVIK